VSWNRLPVEPIWKFTLKIFRNSLPSVSQAANILYTVASARSPPRARAAAVASASAMMSTPWNPAWAVLAAARPAASVSARIIIELSS